MYLSQKENKFDRYTSLTFRCLSLMGIILYSLEAQEALESQGCELAKRGGRGEKRIAGVLEGILIPSLHIILTKRLLWN